ncbi:magnesium ion transporter [Lobulomyces angularis]|nr:magnesium ion transporter [Lobulomyces angularis]
MKPSSNKAPSILVREKAIIVNLGNIRALIKDDCVYIFDSPSEETHEIQSFLMHELQGNILSNSSSKYFELKCLEAILNTNLHSLLKTQSVILPQIEDVLEKLNLEVNQELLKSLLILKNEFTQFKATVDSVHRLYDNLLSNNEDLASMFLSEKANNKPRKCEDHGEVELLLEHYQGSLYELSSITELTMTTIQATESLIQLSLDTQRNNLIVLDLRATLATLSISLSTFMTSIFGMNLYSGLEENTTFMLQFTLMSISIGTTLFIINLWKVSKIRSWNVGVSSWIKSIKKISNSSRNSL